MTQERERTATSYGTPEPTTGPPPVELDDGVYPATLLSVEDAEGRWGPQYRVEWELDDEENEQGELIHLVDFVKIPRGLIEDGVLHVKSNLYLFMEGIGCDMERPRVVPREWIGKKANLLCANEVIQEGDRAGEERVQIKKVSQPRNRRRARPQGEAEESREQPRREPRRTRARRQEPEQEVPPLDDDDLAYE